VDELIPKLKHCTELIPKLKHCTELTAMRCRFLFVTINLLAAQGKE
jgi:hypothetical protein